MACGLPVVVAGGVNLAPDVAKSAAGWVTSDDEAGLAATLVTAMRDQTERARRSVNARALAERYSWDAAAARLHDWYAELIARPVAAEDAADHVRHCRHLTFTHRRFTGESAISRWPRWHRGLTKGGNEAAPTGQVVAFGMPACRSSICRTRAAGDAVRRRHLQRDLQLPRSARRAGGGRASLHVPVGHRGLLAAYARWQ
jgi:hypothetical protein